MCKELDDVVSHVSELKDGETFPLVTTDFNREMYNMKKIVMINHSIILLSL